MPGMHHILHHRHAGRLTWPTLALAASLVVLLGACSNSNSGQGAASQSAAQASATQSAAQSAAASTASGGTVVKLSGLAFDPTTLTVPAGTKVTFKNLDTLNHTVTNGKNGTPAAGAKFNQTVPAGGSFDFTFTTAGTYDVTCTIHAFMNMTVTVQ
jgi:plastocyanin